MESSTPAWAQSLYDGLKEWGAGRPVQASNKLLAALTEVERLTPPSAFWQAILENLLAVTASEAGLYGQVQQHQDHALELWEQSGRTPQVASSLDYFYGLLQSNQLGAVADRVKALYQTGQPPLLDPWSNPKEGPPAAPTRLEAKPAAEILRPTRLTNPPLTLDERPKKPLLPPPGGASLLRPDRTTGEHRLPPRSPTRPSPAEPEQQDSPSPRISPLGGQSKRPDKVLPLLRGGSEDSGLRSSRDVPPLKGTSNTAGPDDRKRRSPFFKSQEGLPPAPLEAGGALAREAAEPSRKLFNSSVEVGPEDLTDWTAKWTEVLRLAGDHQLMKAVRMLEDELRPAAILLPAAQRSLRLAWTYNAEAIAYFLGGDYPESNQAFQHAENHWAEVRSAKDSWEGGATSELVAALRAAGRDTEARIIEDRVSRRVSPLLNPWQDLTGQLDQVTISPSSAAGFSSQKDWTEKMERAVTLIDRQDHRAAQQILSQLLRSMQHLGTRHQVQIVLTKQLLLFATYQTGDFAETETLYNEANETWKELSESERQEGGYLVSFRSLLRDHNFDEMASRIHDDLFSPFTTRSGSLLAMPTHQMESEPEEPSDPLQAWELWMRESWSAAHRRDFQKAMRCAVRAEDSARKLGTLSLYLCYATNSHAVFLFLAGDYPQSEALYDAATDLWKRSSKLATAKPAWNDFVRILSDTDWPEQSRSLKAKWGPVAQPSAAALLTPDVDIGSESMVGYATGSGYADEAELKQLIRQRQGRASKIYAVASFGMILTLGLGFLNYNRIHNQALDLPSSEEWNGMNVTLSEPQVSSHRATFKVIFKNATKDKGFVPDSNLWIYRKNPKDHLWEGSCSSAGGLAPGKQRAVEVPWDMTDNASRSLPKGRYHAVFGFSTQTPMLQQDVDVP